MTKSLPLLFALLLSLACTASLSAQPTRPKPAPAIEGYGDWGGRIIKLSDSPLVSLSVLGWTQGDWEVNMITVTRGPKTEANHHGKPAILIVGNVHAPHLAGGEMALRLAKALADKADDEKIKPLLDRFTFYFIPRPSPEASEAFNLKPHHEREGNTRETDDDRDGSVSEDGPDDLNGDGEITMMRIVDPAGEWMEHPDDPRVLIKADPLKNETGKYRVMVEGRDNDSDEQFNEDGLGGVSFNRNFTHQYPYFKPGAGPHQVSEPETRAVADFAFDRTNIAAVVTFTPEDNLFNTWKPNPQAEGARIKTTLHSADAPYQEFVAKAYREAHGGKDAPSSPKGEGSFSEWAYYHYGRWSFAARGWWVPKVEEAKKEEPKEGEKKDDKKEPAKKPSDEKRGSDDINALRWLAAQKIDGFVEWKKIDHPDFKGKTVEVGGFKPFVLTSPPIAELDALTEKHLKWLVELAGLMPKVSVSDVKVEALGASVFRITATVTNTGYLPTMSEMGRITRQPLPLQLAIELPKDGKVINGSLRTRLDVLKGNGGKTEHTWLIRAEGKAKVKVWSPSVGEHGVEVELK